MSEAEKEEPEIVHREERIIEQRASFSELEEWRKIRKLMAYTVIFVAILTTIALIIGLISYQKLVNVLEVGIKVRGI